MPLLKDVAVCAVCGHKKKTHKNDKECRYCNCLGFTNGPPPAPTSPATVQPVDKKKYRSSDIHKLTEALRLTVEYVGMDTLPPIEGWSWFDAMVKYAPDLAQKMRNEWEQRQINKVRGFTVDHGSIINDVPDGTVRITDAKTGATVRDILPENREQQIQREHREKIARSKSYGMVHYFESEFGNSRLLCNNNDLLTALGTHVMGEVTCPECRDILDTIATKQADITAENQRKPFMGVRIHWVEGDARSGKALCGQPFGPDCIVTRMATAVTCPQCQTLMQDPGMAKAPENKRAQILRTAESLINGDRADTYGPPEISFGRIAKLLNAMGWRKFVESNPLQISHVELNAIDVALGLTQLKVSRIIGQPDHEDSWVDAAGYIGLGAEMATRSVVENGEPPVD